MGCISFKWIFGLIGLKMAGGRGFLFGFLLGWYIDYLIRPKVHFTYRQGSAEDFFRQFGGFNGYDQSGTYNRSYGNYGRTYGGQQQGGWQPYNSGKLAAAYQTLGLTPEATDDEVRQAYRKLALRYHPDRVATESEQVRQASEKMFQQITEAKDIIFKSRGL